jgi:hypothetical protein
MTAKHLLLGLALAIALTGCSTGENGTDVADNICGQEPCYEGPFDPPWIAGHDYGLEFIDERGISLTYDNRVLESVNALIFSDASEDWAKEDLAQMTENSLGEIKQVFHIGTSAELGIVDLYSKMRIYSKCDGMHDQCANPDGFIMYGLDNPLLEEWWPEDEPGFLDQYRRVVKHELMHWVALKLGGDYRLMDEWFTEGVAEIVSGGTYTPISCWQEVEEWRQDPGHINPISIRVDGDFPDTIQSIGEFYPLFGLAVRWLLDERGGNRSFLDLKALFADVGSNTGFARAFEDHMGLTLESYEARFWELMEAFLPPNCD